MEDHEDHRAPSASVFFGNGLSFLKRQQRDWKVTVARTSLDKLAYQIVYPYLSIYIVALGASATQLGIVNSIGMVIAGLCGPFTGWFIDRIGPKRIYLGGITFMAVSYLAYGLAPSWGITTFAMIAYWLGFSTSIHSCATICGNCLVNRDRATGMMICETVTAGLLGMAGPILATWLVTRGGGVNPQRNPAAFFLRPHHHGRHVHNRSDTAVKPEMVPRRCGQNGSGQRDFPDIRTREIPEAMDRHRRRYPIADRDGYPFLPGICLSSERGQ